MNCEYIELKKKEYLVLQEKNIMLDYQAVSGVTIIEVP